MDAVSWLPKGTAIPQTTWHATPEAADTAAWRLRMLGLVNVVIWVDWAVYA